MSYGCGYCDYRGDGSVYRTTCPTCGAGLEEYSDEYCEDCDTYGACVC